MVLGIVETLDKWGKEFQGFMLENSRNPIVWVGLFFLGILVFVLTYNALNKNQ